MEGTIGGDLRGISASGVRAPQAHVDQDFVHVADLAEITNETQETHARDAVGALLPHAVAALIHCRMRRASS